VALIALDTHGDARATTDACDNDGLLPVHVRILPSQREQEFIRINVPQERLIRRHCHFAPQAGSAALITMRRLAGSASQVRKNQLRGVQLAL
jgi:hypothetical protein